MYSSAEIWICDGPGTGKSDANGGVEGWDLMVVVESSVEGLLRKGP